MLITALMQHELLYFKGLMFLTACFDSAATALVKGRSPFSTSSPLVVTAVVP